VEIPSNGVTFIEKWLSPVTEILSACHPTEGMYLDDRVGWAFTVYCFDKEFLTVRDSDSENPRAIGVMVAGSWIDATVTPIEFLMPPEEYVLCRRSSTKRGNADPASDRIVNCSILAFLLGMFESGRV
jgi:hypothetical protein